MDFIFYFRVSSLTIPFQRPRCWKILCDFVWKDTAVTKIMKYIHDIDFFIQQKKCTLYIRFSNKSLWGGGFGAAASNYHFLWPNMLML